MLIVRQETVSICRLWSRHFNNSSTALLREEYFGNNADWWFTFLAVIWRRKKTRKHFYVNAFFEPKKNYMDKHVTTFWNFWYDGCMKSCRTNWCSARPFLSGWKKIGVYFYIQSWTCSNTSSWSYHTANFSFSLPPTPPLSLCQGTRYLTFKPQLLCRQIVIAKARRFKLSGKWTCAKGLRVKPHKHKEFILDIEMFRNEASGIHRRCCLFLTLSVHPSAPPGLLLPKPTHPLL